MIPPLANHLHTGKRGEEVAARYLHHLGFAIRQANVLLDRDEIDVVAFDPRDRLLVFVEVRTRSIVSTAFPPSSMADARKRSKLRRSALKWIAAHDYRGGYRIDLLCVHGRSVVAHFRGITSDECTME